MTFDGRKFLRGHPRALAAFAIGIVAYMLMAPQIVPHLLPWIVPALRTVIAWDCGAAALLAASAWMFLRADADRMPRDAERQQEGAWTIFWVTLGAVVFSFTAVVDALSGTSHLAAPIVKTRVAVVAATLLLSWMLTQCVFAIRYAHEYYERLPNGALQKGLSFPDEDEPDYWDFVYFSVVLGMTFQVSDVAIGARPLRRLAAVHGFLGFLFNTVIIALTVNLAAALV